jgi:hypothetical protein
MIKKIALLLYVINLCLFAIANAEPPRPPARIYGRIFAQQDDGEVRLINGATIRAKGTGAKTSTMDPTAGWWLDLEPGKEYSVEIFNPKGEKMEIIAPKNGKVTTPGRGEHHSVDI